MKKLCIYHGNCFDGFTAAWVVRRAYGDQVEFHAGVYGDPPPDVKGRDVIIVDFSYDLATMTEICHNAASVVWLDHHKSVLETADRINVRAFKTRIIDMNRSGAGIAWDYFFNENTRPRMIDHVEDRDLWRFRIQGTREYHAAMSSYPFDFEAWDAIFRTVPEAMYDLGAAIDRKHLQDVKSLLPLVTRMIKIGDYAVPIANLPMTMTSDAGNLLCEMHNVPYAGCYWDTPKGRVFSLRSLADGADVAVIAQKYGGGGHAHAAGFQMPTGWEGDNPEDGCDLRCIKTGGDHWKECQNR